MMDKPAKKTEIFFLLILFSALIVIRVVIYNVFDSHIAEDTLKLLVSLLIKFLIWVLPVFLYLKFIDKKEPFAYLKLNTFPKKAVIWILTTIAVGVLWQLMEIHYRNDTIGPVNPNTVLSLIIIPVFEEILMRGFILNKLAEIMSFAKALFLSAGFFMLLHLPNWFLITPLDFSWPMDYIGKFITHFISVFFIVGCMGGVAMRKSGSLYPSMVLHIINNFISSI